MICWAVTPEQSDEDDEDEGLGGSGGRVRETVLKDLGNKVTGNEMDTITKTVQHGYYLRSLDQNLSFSGPDSQRRTPIPPSTLPHTTTTTTTTCLYDIPKPRLPAPPTPRGTSAADYYDALDARDQEIRKGSRHHALLSATSLLSPSRYEETDLTDGGSSDRGDLS